MSLPELPPTASDLAAIAPERIAACLLEPVLVEAIGKINDQYFYWSEMRRRLLPAGTDAVLLWQVARQLRRQSAWKWTWKSGSEQWHFSYNLPKSLQQVLYALDEQLGGERRSVQSLLTGTERQHLLVNARMEEAIASSQMEGASTTREAAKQLLRARRKPLNKSERMIVNNYQTMRHLQDSIHRPLSIESLLEIQALVTHGTLDAPHQVGQLRTNDNISVVDHSTSEVVHYPPGCQHLPALLTQLCDFANASDATHHPLVAACLLHFLIGFIHPFVDGNGRTARAVFYWYLLRRNYWLVEYMPLSRIIKRSAVQYGRAYLFTEADDNDITYFIKYHLHVLAQAYADLQEYVARQKQQVYQTRQLLLTGLNGRQIQIVQWLRDKPETTLTIRDVQHRFGVVYDTARTDLMHLEKLGLLDKRREGKVKILYLRAENFDEVVAGLKGGR
ncbi:Fic family protein [Hymenobacter caeli]|uniref:Fic family protein n=1 Tax=Hymenobacter caeli TaxID=2735894 RepID=A0ABX2FP07_9BACT|nr:Fic family protein [Hymenobacter caeli]NRT18901.1 Fic family protein [Hymenobacter caeli]